MPEGIHLDDFLPDPSADMGVVGFFDAVLAHRCSGQDIAVLRVLKLGRRDLSDIPQEMSRKRAVEIVPLGLRLKKRSGQIQTVRLDQRHLFEGQPLLDLNRHVWHIIFP